MRINKYIAHAGVASRRKAEELIKQGLVTLNGQMVTELATTVNQAIVSKLRDNLSIMKKKFTIFSINHAE